MLHIIIAILIAAALYGLGMWAYVFVLLSIRGRSKLPENDRAGIELFTFHLGLIGVLALGFVGLILVLGGY